MRLSRASVATSLLLFALLTVIAVGLWPELSISRVDANDNVFHYTLVERIVHAVERGENPLDCWSAEWSLGYPVMRTYQPLAHGLVALIYFALGKSVDLMTIFVWVRFLALVLLPLSFFAAARLIGLSRGAALATAFLSPMVSANLPFGIEQDSFIWAGSGLFPQLVATHFLLLAIGFGCRAMRRGRGLTVAGALLGLTFLCHMVYGYLGALSFCLMAAVPDRERALSVRVRRVVWMGAAALATVAFQLAPMLRDSANINHSRMEAQWKWDSFGAGNVMLWLANGKLLDNGRLPILTFLALAGAVRLYWERNWQRWFAALGAGFWLLMFFGRPVWGPVLVILGVLPDTHLHRVIAGAQIFLVLLGGISLAEIWDVVSRRLNAAAALGAMLVLLLPMAWERANNLTDSANRGETSLAAYTAAKPDLEAAMAKVAELGGRTYAGFADGWGAKIQVRNMPAYTLRSIGRNPNVGFTAHAMSLAGDIMVRFDQANAAHYRLFNVRSVVSRVPAGAAPPFLVGSKRFGEFEVFEAPGGGYFDLVDVPASVKTTKLNFYEVNERWLAGDWVARRLHLWLDWHGDAPLHLLRAPFDGDLPPVPETAEPPGEFRSDRRTGEEYAGEFDATRNCFALFKMTWHRNWHAYVDGARASTAMLSPGFVGIPVTAGHHGIVMRYEPGNGKLIAALLVVPLLFLLGALEFRGFPAVWERLRMPLRAPRQWWVTGGIALLSLPVCIPLFTSQVLWGDDSFRYFTRLTEVHQNLINGIALPRWAPDFGMGTGQPLFVFHPPMFYSLAELFHLLGFDFTTAVNLACVPIVLASGASIFLLARLYFGEAGGWLAATAYLYAPYLAVDLFVRSSLEEFTTFPFLALAMYGFGAYALQGKRRHWLVGGAAYAAVVFSSFPSALIYSPLLAAFVAFAAWRARSWKVLFKQAGGMAFGLALALCVWLPAVVERQDVWMERVLDGVHRYSNHLLDWRQLFYSPWGYGVPAPGSDDGISFALGRSHLLLGALVCVLIARRGKQGERRLVCFFAAASILLCVPTLRQMQWLWDYISLLQFVVWPWRLLGMAALCLAMLAGALGPVLTRSGRWRKPAMAAAMGLLMIPNLSHLHPRAYRDVDTAFWTPRQMAVRGWEATMAGEVTPRWVETAPFYNPAAAYVTDGEAQVRQISRTPFSWVGAVSASTAATVGLSTAYYPGWEVRLDGRQVPFYPSPGTGMIRIPVSPGEHRAEAVWRGTAMQRWSQAASLAALAAWLFLFAVGAPQPTEIRRQLATPPASLSLGSVATTLRFVDPAGPSSDIAIGRSPRRSM